MRSLATWPKTHPLTCYGWSAPSVKGIDAVSCKSTSASLFIIQEWCPRPSLAVMSTGLQVRFLPWHHCQPCFVCNFVSFRCSKEVLTLMASLNIRYDLEDREDAWFLQARRSSNQKVAEGVKSAMRSPPRQSRPFASVRWSNVLWPSLAPWPSASTWCGGQYCSYNPFSPCTRLHPRGLLLDLLRLLGLALRLSRSCLAMPPGNLCHAGCWHLRRKPCVEASQCPMFVSPWHSRISVRALTSRCGT